VAGAVPFKKRNADDAEKAGMKKISMKSIFDLD